MINSIYLSILVTLVACTDGSDYGSGNPSGSSSKKAAGGEPAVRADPGKNSDVGSGNNTARGEPVAAGEKRASFSFGPKAAMADFLFVFDNSVSMRTSLDQLRAGFASLNTAAWPSDSRIAVMTTLPGDPSNLSTVHPTVKRYANIDLDPGFLNLVNEAGRRRFIDAAGTAADDKAGFAEQMCAADWFKPSDVNSAGKPCLSVAIQSPFRGVGVEAGLVALSQIVKKRAQLFRRGSNVNVVFVSDTQDPGKNEPSVQQLRPTFAQLKPLIEQNTNVASVKLHGVTPSVGCTTNEGTPSLTDGRGLPYQTAIADSGGVWLDYCDGAAIRSDYKPVAQQILAAALPEPVFVLPQTASKIVRVSVGGLVFPVDRIALSVDKKSVRLNGLSPTKDVTIEVIYQP